MLHRKVAAPLALVLLALAASDARAEGARCGTDDFSGAALNDRWSVLRPAPDGPAVAGGRLRLPMSEGSLAGTEATARNVVLQPAPAGGWTMTARVGTGAVDRPGERAGLVLWRSEGPEENAFATATFTRTAGGAPRFEALQTDGSVLAIPLARSATDAPAFLPPDAEVLIRLRSDGAVVRAAYSADDGASWTPIGASARIGGPVRVGVLALGQDGSASIDDVTLSCGPQVALTSEPERGPASLEMGISATIGDDRDDPYALHVLWDFGDGTGGEGGHARFHKYLEPGTYHPTVWATDSDGNVTTASRTISVLASDAPCPAWSDVFAGNGLDPRWSVLRPVPTGLDVRDGALWLRPYAGAFPGGARNVVGQAAPAGPWTMTAAVDVAALDAPGDQAGLVLWRPGAPGDGAKLVFDRTAVGDPRLLRAARDGVAEVAGGPSETVHLRIASSGARPPVFTAQHSADGEAWSPVGAPFAVPGAGQLQLGMVALGSSVSEPAGFAQLAVDGEAPCGAPDTVAPETTHTLDRRPDGTVRVTLAAVDDATGSGVAGTEYRVGAGSFAPYTSPFTLSGPGEHAVEYRSRDRAGNVELPQLLRVAIAAPPPADRDEESGPGPAVPRGVTDRHPTVGAMVRLTAPRRLHHRRLARRGVRVRLACRGAVSVRVKLSVGRRVARRLQLGRGALGGRVARCDAPLSVRLTLRPGARRAVRRATRPFRATIEARAAGARRDRVRVRVTVR